MRQLLILPAETPIIGKVQAESPAAAAGLQARDIVHGFNHHPIFNPIALLEYIKKHPDETLTLDVERTGSRLEVPVKPTPLPTEDTEGKKNGHREGKRKDTEKKKTRTQRGKKNGQIKKEKRTEDYITGRFG